MSESYTSSGGNLMEWSKHRQLTVVILGRQQAVLRRHRLAEVGVGQVVAVAGVGAVGRRRVAGHRLLVRAARSETG